MPAAKGSVPWNAGKGKGWTDKRGYRWTYVMENGRRRAKREHRLVMEAHLERPLTPFELVHHKDENPSNNAIDNPEVIEWGEHSIMHHIDMQRPDQAKRTMQVFAQLREENKRLNDLKADMLAALRTVVASGALTHFADTNQIVREAIAKAEGK